jgi:hypothetical protein
MRKPTKANAQTPPTIVPILADVDSPRVTDADSAGTTVADPVACDEILVTKSKYSRLGR